MSLHISSLPLPGQIQLAGKFIRETAFEFAKAYRFALHGRADDTLTIHMDEVDHIDTAGLGMLLVMHRDASHQGTKVVFKGCQPIIREVLAIANLNKLFVFAD